MSNDEIDFDWMARFALPADAVTRILADVREGSGKRDPVPVNLDRDALAQDLGRAKLDYQMRRADDHEPRSQVKQLEELGNAVSRFQKALRSYEERGRPGWPFLRKIAEEYHERALLELNEIEARRTSLEEEQRVLRLHERDLLRSEALGEQAQADLDVKRKAIQRKLTRLNGERAAREREIITFDNHAPEGILAQLDIGLDLLAEWLHLGFAKRDTLIGNGQNDPLMAISEAEGYTKALRWLAKIQLPQIYERYFGRRFGRSRKDEGRQQGRADGPAIRFAVAAAREMDVRNKDGGFLTASSIEDYWRRS